MPANNEIENVQAKIIEVGDEIKSFQGNLVIKSQKIAEQELQLKWFSEKQKILTEQKQDLEKQTKDLPRVLKRVQQDSDSERDAFLEEAEQFCCMYDLISDGRKKREINRKRKLEELKSFKEKLTAEIQEIRKEKDKIGFLESKKRNVISQISQLEAKHEGINKLVKTKEEETEKMEMDKVKVAEKPQTDPEFQRISAELHACKENSLSLEGVCDAVSQELNELQQQFYQKQLQRQRKQRQVQKQQQKEQWQQQLQQKKQQLSKQQQQTHQRWQQQQQSHGQRQHLPPKQWLLGDSQQKNVQKPLFDPNSQKDQRHDESNVDESYSTLRMQPHLRKSFHY